MLYVNDELIKKGSPQWERYEKFKREVLSKMKNPVIFKTGRPIRFNSNGLPEQLPNEIIPLDHNLSTEDGDEHWRIAKRPPRKKDNNLVWEADSRRKILKNAWVLDKTKDQELIFFLLTVSPFVSKGRMYLEDKEKEAREDITKQVGELDVKFMILSDSSPLSPKATGSEDTLRLLAAAWGISGAHNRDDQNIDQIKLALWAAVQLSQQHFASTQRGYKEFMAEADAKSLLEIRANIQKAIDTGLVVYDTPSFSWRFASNNVLLMVVPASEAADPQSSLYNFLSLNTKSAQLLKFAMSEPHEFETTSEDVPDIPVITGKNLKIDSPRDPNKPTPEDVQAMSWQDFRKLATELDVKTFGKKRPELEEIVIGVLA